MPAGESITINKGYSIYLLNYVRYGQTGLYVAKTTTEVAFVAGTQVGNIVFSKTEYSLTITNNNDAGLRVIAIGQV